MKKVTCEYCEEFKPVCKHYDKTGMGWILCKDCLKDFKEHEAKKEREEENE